MTLGRTEAQVYARPVVATPQLEPWRPTLETYLRLGELGIFDDERVELLDGVITPMSPKGPAHEHLKAYLTRRVIECLDASWQLRIEGTLPMAEGWAPEPDLALARRVERVGGKRPHPTRAEWVCEIADSTLRRDREVKRIGYARAGIPEFWLLDVNAQSVEVFRDPAGDDYRERTKVSTGILESASVQGLAVDLGELWEEL